MVVLQLVGFLLHIRTVSFRNGCHNFIHLSLVLRKTAGNEFWMRS